MDQFLLLALSGMIIIIVLYGISARPVSSGNEQKVFLPIIIKENITCDIDKLAFVDNFSDPSSGWGTLNTFYNISKYQEGKFLIAAPSSAGIAISRANSLPAKLITPEQNRYRLSVDAKWSNEPAIANGDPSGGYGVMVEGWNDSQNILQGYFLYLFPGTQSIQPTFQLHYLSPESSNLVFHQVGNTNISQSGLNDLVVERYSETILRIEINGSIFDVVAPIKSTVPVSHGVTATQNGDVTSPNFRFAEFDNFKLETCK